MACCPDCGRVFDTHTPVSYRCPPCHAFRTFLNHVRDTPPAPDYRPSPYYAPPDEQAIRPTSSGRRVHKLNKSLQ